MNRNKIVQYIVARAIARALFFDNYVIESKQKRKKYSHRFFN